MKTILLLCILISLGLQVTVTDTDKCSACTDFKSQADCVNASNGFGCEWKNSACAQITITPVVFQEYCQTLTDPTNKCAKAFGCAFVDSKCTHFTGCTAYVKTTLADCQAISYQCITNGVTCDDVKLCKDYTKDECETNPSPYSPYKCKLDGDTCRDLKCTEADNSLITDSACDAWLDGCVTTGYGCIDVLPNCSQFTGTSDICNKMVGKDGNCTLDASSTTTPQACKLRVCSEAALTTWDSTSCGNYKTGCKTTGFSCVDSLAVCSSYTGTATTCLNFFGSDGQCAADAAATQCRARKCEDKVSGVLTDCTGYLLGCKTNGVTCVTSLGNCSTYKGTITTCAKIVGLDGNCKGTSATDATVACALKTCADDDAGTESTDTACQLVQKSCKTTGKGCVASLSSCTSYTDDGNCLKYVGSEGKCKAGAGGATPKCAARACADNTTATTNTDCQNYLPGCVTNGAGCVAEANCTDTVSKLTCTGTTNNYSCAWTEGCVAKNCTAFSSNQSLCSNTSTSDTQPCIWKTNACYNAVCGDFTETDDTKCTGHMSGCVTNGTKCADPTDCTQFSGNMTTCRGFTKAKCTNTDDNVAATAACVAKTCGDGNITATQDSDCDAYLTGCLFSGDTTNKCVANNKDCTYFFGASASDCSKFSGYRSATARDPCWYISGSKCVTKTCDLASGMTNNTDCAGFMTGCVYDGNTSCLDENSLCTSFKLKSGASQCSNLTGNKGAQKCFDGSGNNCKIRECADAVDSVATPYKTDQNCENFLSGCLSTGAGCVAPEAACSSYSGTQAQCNLFKGNKFPCQRTLKCTALAAPTQCAGKTDATSNAQCVGYKATCALSHGSNNCIDQVAACTGYTLNSSATAADKITYCNTVLTSGGVNCAYDPATTGTCVARTCALWSSTLGVACTSYAGASACSFDNSVCYTPTTCESKTIPSSGVTDKVAYCNKFQNSQNNACTYNTTVTPAATTCKTMNKCEEAISPSKQDDCYDQTGQTNCVFIKDACVTIKSTCATYDITSVASGDKATLCSTLRANNSGTITPCKFTTGNACDTLTTCEDILGATTQKGCDAILTGCKYYNLKCYTIKACASYALPSDASDDAKKTLFCQNMYNTGGTDFCSFTSTQTTCDTPKACTDYGSLTAADSGNAALCSSKRDKTTGTVCKYAANTDVACSLATGADICTLITSVTADSDCDLHTLPLGCKISSGNCAARAACTGTTPTAGSEISQCQALIGPDGLYCSFVSGTTTCVTSKDSCSLWTGGSIAACSVYIDKHGNACSWTTGANCSAKAKNCLDAYSPQSQADCDALSAGCLFIYDSCVNSTLGACATYTLPTAASDAAKKLEYCQGRVTDTGTVCTYISGTTCVAAAACSAYTASGTPFSDKLAYCKKLVTTDNNGCTYSSGTNCQEAADQCTSYTVASSGDCTSLTDNQGRACVVVGTATTCSYPLCSTISSPTPTKQDDCDAVVPGCFYQSSKCLVIDTCASYVPGGSAISYCAGLKDKNGVQCFANADSDSTCTARTCSDAATKYFTTHKECQDYSPLCKSDGVGCIDISTACTSQNGDATSCAWLLDATDFNKCGTPTDASGTCAPITCSMNVTALSQTDCDSFIVGGNCMWKNPGCYDSTIPCSQYRGTLTDCQKYVGGDIPCFSDSATRGACRDRTCADKTGATSDDDCKTFLSSCLYNGKGGCIDKNSDCTLFSGTSTTCNNIKGVSGTQICWSGSTTVSSCKIRDCTQLSGTSDADCDAFMPSSSCISNGTKCIVGPKNCSFFSGNDDSCGKFTAFDGPCKANSQSVSAVSCTPKVCYEAPNTFTTDAQCKAYHPSCKTTGRGCQSTVLCGDYQNKTVCGTNNLCLWAQSCRVTSTTCSSLTASGQTVCVNNPAKKCAWFSGNGVASAACRDYQCADYDATLTTHDACQSASNKTCTTTGAGCVTFSTCSTYANASICAAAQTTETQKKCTWENAKCRPQQCKDLKGALDTDCSSQLPGCKSNGTTCIGPTYSCSDFNGSQKFCLIDSTGQPCLYIGGICYSYDNCTDVATPTQAFCQTFSTNCVVGQTTCVALNQCSSYDKQVSCLVGVNKSTCGWLPTQKCAEFKQCSDATGTTWSDCAAWNSSCVSDGTACVPLGDCTSYLKQLSCENNYDTAKNICFWTGTACRQKQCSDATATTDTDCLSNTVAVKEGPCTTDGTKCVARAACTSYVQTGCTVGSDAIPCFYGYAVGQTTGNQSCRAQECTDIAGATNDACIGKINKKPCVSNGKTCVAQGTCGSYKNKLSCAAGGSDNLQCVFTAAATATDPLAGTCVAFTACANANGDKTTCLTNKSCKYTDATNICATTDCATYNGSGKCNPFPSFDGKSFTLCVTSSNGCAAGDPTAIVQADCWATTRYTYTWNASTNKCASCKGSTPANNSSNGNNSNGNTTTDSGYVLGASMVFALLGFMA